MDNAGRQAKLVSQIQKRLDILKEWDAQGVPPGYALPTSLNKARDWNDLEYGIEKIGSPSSFTTNHMQHGKSVSEIHKLLVKLNSPARKRPKSNPAKRLQEFRAKLMAQEEALIRVANQFAQLSWERDRYKKLYRVAQQSQGDAQEELAVAQDEIRELKVQLVRARAKINPGKVASIDFGGKRDAD